MILLKLLICFLLFEVGLICVSIGVTLLCVPDHEWKYLGCGWDSTSPRFQTPSEWAYYKDKQIEKYLHQYADPIFRYGNLISMLAIIVYLAI